MAALVDRVVIVSVAQDLPAPASPAGQQAPITPSLRISVSAMTTPGSVPSYTQPPLFVDSRDGARLYFVWELRPQDYARRFLDKLQEVLLTVALAANDAGVTPPLPPPANKFKPCLDAYDLLKLVKDQGDAVATFLFRRAGSEAGKLAGEEAARAALDEHLEGTGVAIHRVSFSEEDGECLTRGTLAGLPGLTGMLSFASAAPGRPSPGPGGVCGLGRAPGRRGSPHPAGTLETAEAPPTQCPTLFFPVRQFKQHVESKASRLRYLRGTHKHESPHEQLEGEPGRIP
jgi:hypothetical protein